MHVQNCKHPVVITNKATGEKISVPCGRCSACLNQRVLMLTRRCDLESASHKYAVFATLTYADYDVPQVVRLRAEDTPRQHDICYVDGSTGEFFDFYDPSIKRHNDKDVKYCYQTKVLPILLKSDFQKFIKRFRYYANEIENGVTIRYFLTGEYGETTFRPHGHVIFWFDSESIASRFKEIIHKSWKHGYVYDPHIIDGSASNYVSSYVNGIVSLPSIYHHRKLRPFVLFSKFPILGSLYERVPTLREFFDRGVNYIPFKNASDATFINVPLWRSLRDRFCPRIQRFSVLSTADRITLYRLCVEHEFEDPYKFAEFLYYNYVRGNRITFVSRYLYEICHKSVSRLKFSNDGSLHKYLCDELETCINSLVQFCRTIQRAKNNAAILQISLSDYVTKMSIYYENLDKQKYKEYCEYRDEYFKDPKHPARDMLLFDYTFVQRVNGRDFACLSPSDQHYLKLCGVCDDGTTTVHLCLDDCLDYHIYHQQQEQLAASLVKNKVRYDYMISKSDDMKNILNYFSNE